MPKMVLAPSFIVILLFVYGFIAWTTYVSFTRSRQLLKYEIEGVIQYNRLLESPRWDVAMTNLAIFGIMFIVIPNSGAAVSDNLVKDGSFKQGALRAGLYAMLVIFAFLLFGCFIPFQVILLPMAIVIGKMKIAGSIGGQRQRVAMGRAMVRNPQLFFV